MSTLTKILLLVLLAPLLQACSESCSQDPPIPILLTVHYSPYAFVGHTSAYDINGFSWQNLTTGQSGVGTISGPIYKCFFPLCGYWMQYSADIELQYGENLLRVTKYYADTSCGFYDDYIITYE